MDKFSPSERSNIMRKVKSSGNKSTEVKFIEILKQKSITGWRRNYNLLGKPDFVFPKHKICVFIDGCFWHGCNKHCRMPSSNTAYWVKKIAKNKARDRFVTKELREKGWMTIRIWEHELTESNQRKIQKIKRLTGRGN